MKSGSIFALRFTPDGQRLCTVSRNGQVAVWDSSSGTLQMSFQPEGSEIVGAEIEMSGRHILILNEKRLETWSLVEGAVVSSIDVVKGVTAFALSPSGAIRAVGTASGAVLLCKADGSVVHTLTHSAMVLGLDFSPDGSSLAVTTTDDIVSVWNVSEGLTRWVVQPQKELLYAGPPARPVRWSRSGSALAFGSGEGLIRIFSSSGEVTQALSGHRRTVFDLDWAPGGLELTSTGFDRTMRVWDVPSGKMRSGNQGHFGRVSALAVHQGDFSDGSRIIASGGEDGWVRVWDDATGDAIMSKELNINSISSLAFSPDGEVLVAGGIEGLASFRPSKPDQAAVHTAGRLVTDVAFDPSDRLFAFSTWQNNLVVTVDREDGSMRHLLKGHTGFVNALTFDRSGRRLVSGDEDGQIIVWDAQEGTQLISFDLAPVSVLSVAEDDRTLIVGTTQGHIVRWDLESEQLINTVSRIGGRVGGLTLLGPRWLAAGTAKGAIHIWDLLNGSLLTIIEGHSGVVNDVVAVGDGTGLISASDDGAVRRWSLPEFVEGAPLGSHTAEVTSVRFYPSGRRLASAGRDGLIQVWDLAQHALVGKLVGHKQGVEAIAISPDGSQLVSASKAELSGGGSLRVWNTESETTVLELADLPFGLTINALTFRPDGKVIAGASTYQDEVFLWDAETGLLINRLAQLKKQTSVRFKAQRFGGNNSLAYFPDGKALAVAGPWGVRVWDPGKGEISFVLDAGEIEVNDVVVTPDGNRIVGALADGNVAVWNLSSRQISMILRAHEGPTFRVAIDKTGQLAVSGGVDGWLKVWNLNDGTERYAHRGHLQLISSLAMHPDGTSVASGSYDTTVRRWTVVPAAKNKSSRIQTTRFVGIEVEYLPPVPTLFAPRPAKITSEPNPSRW